MLCVRNVQMTRVLPSSQKTHGTALLLRHKSLKLYANYSSVKSNTETTVIKEEVKKFQELAGKWWDSTFDGLHAMNTLRVPFIRDGMLQLCPGHLEKGEKPLTGLTILDVGCGGGILAEPLARLGAYVTGLDPGETNVKVAQYHCSLDLKLRDNLEYICTTVEDHCKDNKKYDAVVCSEVIEHVDRVPYFVKCCTDLVKDNGSVFFTTINRTTFSYVFAILLAEHIFRFIPKGTHEWKQFIKPKDLQLMLQSHGCKTISVRGMAFVPLLTKWFWVPYQGCFYALHAKKEVIPGST